ncbi:NUT family member 2G [Labeo rohita]|uniref:NUT family member 2G n=1 Tax=Labeo rohita TaxID=84645 RepID=A0A498NX49_LABRO|nr:NUT family member 2G [Labeo rohita]
MPHFNPSWPVLVPHLNPTINASVPHHNPFCPIYTPKLNFNLPFKPNFKAPVACENHSYSSLVLRPHLNVYPVCPTPNIYQPNVQMIRTDRDHPGRFLRDVQDSFRLWQRLCETARLFCSGSPDAEALACYFMRVIPSLSIHRSDVPFSAAVNAAVQEWRKTSNFDREQYYSTATMFIEMEKQDKSINRANPQTDKSKEICLSSGQHLPHSSGELKKTGRRSKKVSVLDLTENALNEYSQVMDSLESKVTDGSEVTAADEEDVCALFLNQLLKDSDSTSEAGFDINYISSLLSTDTCSNMTPEPVAGCSDWTYNTVSETQILSPSAVQHDFSPSKGTNLLLSEDHVVEKIFAPFQDDIKGQNEFQTLTEALPVYPEGQSSKTDPNTLFQETIHPELQDFGPEVDGNQKDKTLFVGAQANCFNLQNYNSHQAIFPQTIKHDPETCIDGGIEHDGEENMVVSQKTEIYMRVEIAGDSDNMDSDIPDDFQRIRSFCNKQTNMKESPNTDKSEENNVNKNKKHKRQHRRRKHQKITPPVERMSPKLDNKDKRRLKTTENQPGKTDSATKHEVQETDFKIIVKKGEFQQHANITETTSSAMKGRRGSSRQPDKQIGKIREHLDGGFERKTLRRQVREQCLTKAERDGGKAYRRAEGGRPKKQENVLETIEKDRGDFCSSREVSASATMKKDANKPQRTNDKRSTQKQAKKEG